MAQCYIVKIIKAVISNFFNHPNTLGSNALRTCKCGILSLPCNKLVCHQNILISFVYKRVSYNSSHSVIVTVYILVRKIMSYLGGFYKRQHIYSNLCISVYKTLPVKCAVKNSRYEYLIGCKQRASEIQTLVRIMISAHHKHLYSLCCQCN